MNNKRSMCLVKRKLFNNVLLPFFLLLFAGMAACNNQRKQVAQLPKTESSRTEAFHRNDSIIQLAAAIIRTGDLILRTGTDFSSEEVKSISPTDKTYSHAGIALADSNGIFI